MSYTTLLTAQDTDGIVVVTINRPDKLNALNDAVITDLAAFAAWAGTDASVRAVILTGAGEKAFVAGADIAEIARTDATTGAQLAAKGHAAFRALEQLGKPVIAAVNGFALGGGCELAMACHVRYASPNAKFGQPEVKLGLIPGYGGTVRLPRLVGRGRALELLMSSAMIDAVEAHRIGLVNKVVPQESLLDEVKALARSILQMGPLAVRLVLETVDAALDLPLDAALAHEAAQFGVACGSDDKREGTSAFLEKRPAQFSGR
jgi:enoyl-CoA hydratase